MVIFDVDDRPYAALLVQGDGPNGTTAAVSNTAGFTNFEMLLDGESAFVDRAGTYGFEAVAPAGWVVTSGPPAQSVDFVELEGSPVGIVASGQCATVRGGPATHPRRVVVGRRKRHGARSVHRRGVAHVE